MIILLLLFITIAYLLGSINSAIIVAKLLKLPDPRREGSKNPGTTNILRTGGKQAAAIVLLGDVLKGFLPVFLAHLFGMDSLALALVALAAVLGHLYPIFFNFQGGKGVATMFGAILALSPLLFFIALITWIILTVITRYVSLGSIGAAIALPLSAAFFGHYGYFIPLLFMAGFIIYRHHNNIQRLLAGTENKLRFTNKF